VSSDSELISVAIDKLVHGGQGLGTLESGQKIFVWNALPGETVSARSIKKKKNYLEAIAEVVVAASPERIEPRDDNYLATSPWQIMTFTAENKYKVEIVRELLTHDKVTVPAHIEIIHDEREWQYRAKMEYSFWGDDDGLHLALHRRGSHSKQVVRGSSLAMPAVDVGANAVLAELRKLPDLRAGDLKTIIVRSSQAGVAAAALFVKTEEFPRLELPKELQGLQVIYSNPQSPASVSTKLLYELGDALLSDALLERELHYDVKGFFQVNLPVFEKALHAIKAAVGDNSSVDLYSGVGSIGILLGSRALIEFDPKNVAMARHNNPSGEVIQASSETALDYITGDDVIIVDPPRAGLHGDVTARLLEKQPPMICYLSCNPATQARDLALLQDKYLVERLTVYNFFPRTPHIEALAILRLKK